MKNCRKIVTVCGKIQGESKMVDQKKKHLHETMKWVLVVSQCMGQMPVSGITGSDSSCLKFSWKSWRTLYCVLNCVGAGFITAFGVYRTLKFGMHLFEYVSLAFAFSTFIITLLFLKLATEWPQLMRKWSYVENSMRTYGSPKHLHTRITFMTITVLVIAIIEYLMGRSNNLYLSIMCRNKDDDLLEVYFTRYFFKEFFNTISYALWKGIFMQIENVLMTFAWTFNDLFIMLISTALALHFRLVTHRVKLLKKTSKGNSINVWREVREDYNRLSKITRDLDEALSYITLTSFASNLFFVLVQLFHSLRKMDDTLEKIYFFFSFGFLILRTICVTIYGAWIHDESKEPMMILNSVSSGVYNIEIKRFIEQIKFDTIALTGRNFFYVTRGLILSMAGAVVTYELVLIQFNENVLKESAERALNSTSLC